MFRASVAHMFPLPSIVMLAVELLMHQREGWNEHADSEMLAVIT